MASEIAAPKPGSRRQSKKHTILKHFLQGILKRKSPAPKSRKSRDKSLSLAALMQPFQHDLRCPAAKDNSITHAAALTQPLQCDQQTVSCKARKKTRKNVGKATLELSAPWRSAEAESQNAIELRARTSTKRPLNCQFQCDLQGPSCKSQSNCAQAR